MKKLLLSIALVAGIAAFAQKNISITMTNPENGEILYSGVPFSAQLNLTNEGTEALTNQDTVICAYLLGNNLLEDANGNPILFLYRPTANIAPGASVTVNAPNLTISVTSSISPASFCILALIDGDTTSEGNPGVDNLACSTISIALNTALNEVEKAAGSLKVYPNPVSDVLHFDMDYNKTATIKIMDITGKLVENVSLQFNQATLNVNNYNKGIYLYQIEGVDGKTIKSGKFNVN